MGQRAFKSVHNGHYLAADSGHVKAVQHQSHKSHFLVEEHGGKVALRNGHQYLSVTQEGRVCLVPDRLGSNEEETLFVLDKNHQGHVAIRSHHGKYISLDNHMAHARHAGHNEQIWFQEIVC